MSVSTDYNNVTDITPTEKEIEVCKDVIHENVCIQGSVIITPHVVCGPTNSFCVGKPIIGCCPGRLRRNCIFTVSQNVCVQIPLTFFATASAIANGLVCGNTDIRSREETSACNHTIEFYNNNPELTNELINKVGGSIILGVNNVGLSFTVTIANANAVLDFNTPSPTAPVNPSLSQQYQNLYAQLLAANLNAIALQEQGVEVCSFAVEAINAANLFLANSPTGGTTGAPEYQKPLEEFNSGEAPGCPPHCE